MWRSGEPPLSFPPVLRLAASLRASTAVPGPCLSNKQDLSATLVSSALPFLVSCSFGAVCLSCLCWGGRLLRGAMPVAWRLLPAARWRCPAPWQNRVVAE